MPTMSPYRVIAEEVALAIIAVANPNRGVGKSTTSANLAAGLGSLGASVLVIDLDPAMGVTHILHKRLKTVGLFGMLTQGLGHEVALAPTSAPRVDLLQSSSSIRHLEGTLPVETLTEHLKDVTASYQHVILDTPPSLGTFALAALSVADHLLLPISAQRLHQSAQLDKLHAAVDDVTSRSNPRLRMLGVLLTMVDPANSISSEVEQAVAERYPRKVLDQRIPFDPRLATAEEEGKAVLECDPFSPAAEAYRALAEEISRRVALATAEA